MKFFEGLNPLKIVSAYKSSAQKLIDLNEAERLAFEDTVLEWNSHLNQDYERSDKWYLGFGLVIMGFVVYGILTNQWSFSAAMMVFGGVYYYITHQESPLIDIKLSEAGFVVGERVYPFTSLRTFWIEYNPPYFQNLHLVLKDDYKEEVSIQIHQVDITELRIYLTQHLPEWKERTKTVSENIIQALGL